MIRIMGKPVYEEGLTVRTNSDAKIALGRAVASLKGVRELRFFGNKVSQEAVVNASWLWMESLKPHQLAAILAPHLARLESLMDDSASETNKPPAFLAEDAGASVDHIAIRDHRPIGEESTARETTTGRPITPKGGRRKGSS